MISDCEIRSHEILSGIRGSFLLQTFTPTPHSVCSVGQPYLLLGKRLPLGKAVSYQQYGPLVVDAKAEVNEALASLPSSELKSQLNAAMDAYADAGTAWGGYARIRFHAVYS
jgi:hypothetical protein